MGYRISLERIPMLVDITPSTGLVEALRHSSHTPSTAVADIVDNSIEADAENIHIEIQKDPINKEVLRMVISDDGDGMDESTLIGAFAYGNHTNTDSSLGRFGMGMKTSATSLGEQFTVISKTQNGKLVKGEFVPETILSTRKWLAPVGETDSQEDKNIFDTYVNSESGTVIIISDISKNYKVVSLYAFRDKLIKDLGLTFRHFLTPYVVTELKDLDGNVVKQISPNSTSSTGKVKIFVNEKEVFGMSPLELHLPSTEIVYDDKIEVVSGKFVNAKMTKIAYKIEHPDNFVWRPDHIHQGVYVVRENRAIMDHDNNIFYQIWGARHSSTNHLRIELKYSKELDKEFSVNHDKCGLKTVNQSVMDKLSQILGPIVTQEGKLRSKQSAKDELKNEDVQKIHDGVCKDLISKKNLLDLPTEKKIARAKGTKTGTVTPKGTGITRIGKEKTPVKIGNFTVGYADNGSAGPVFDFEFCGKNGKILWNVAHPFVQTFVTLNGGVDTQIRSLDYIAFAIASYFEQICAENDEVGWESRERFVSSIAQNLRILSQ